MFPDIRNSPKFCNLCSRRCRELQTFADEYQTLADTAAYQCPDDSRTAADFDKGASADMAEYADEFKNILERSDRMVRGDMILL